MGTLELHRPPVNALNHALGAELVDAIEALEDTDVRVVILTGGERMFSAGFDIKELKQADPLDAIGRNRRMYRVYRKVEEARFPVIAAINGYAVGGSCQLVLACDFRVVASDAFFSWPEIDLAGLPPMQRLVRTVGYGQARRLTIPPPGAAERRLSAWDWPTCSPNRARPSPSPGSMPKPSRRSRRWWSRPARGR